MKLFSKVLCILSVLVLCVPFFCLSVSAAELSESAILPSYYGIETFTPNADGSGFKIAAEDIDANGLPLFYQKNYIDTDVTEGEKESLYGEVVSDKTFIKPPYYIDGTNAVNAQDKYVMFTRSLEAAVDYNDMVMTTSNEYYYFTFFYEYSAVTPSIWDSGDYEYTDRIVCNCFTYISETPITFTSTSKGFVLNGSEKNIGFVKWESHEGKYDDEPFNWMYSAMGKGFQSVSNIVFDSSILYAQYDSSSYSLDYQSKCYTNCNIDTSMFATDENLVKGISDLKKETALSKVDVKLTPEFGMGMDRVFDPLTGKKDYFKIEVVNNSDTAIQFSCCIVDEGRETYFTDSGYVSAFAHEQSYWNYIHEASYYQLCTKQEYEYLYFGTNTTFYMEKRKGNVFWVYLPPGGSFEDYIYWENIKINSIESYDFLVEAMPCKADCAVQGFYASEDELKKTFHAYGDGHWWTFYEEYNLDSTVEEYCVNTAFFEEIYRQTFSVISMPNFSSTVSGGNSKINRGWDDTADHLNNAYSKLDLSTGNDIPVSNWEELTLSDENEFSFDVNDVSIEDVREYLVYCTDFFSLIGSVLSFLPTYIWVLIAFGLTAFIIIAIAKWVIT